MILTSFEILRSTVPHLGLAVRTIDQPGKHMGFACLSPSIPLRSNFLDFLKHLRIDDRRLGVVEDCLLLDRIIPLFLIPDRIGVGLEVYGTAGILLTLQNVTTVLGFQ